MERQLFNQILIIILSKYSGILDILLLDFDIVVPKTIGVGKEAIVKSEYITEQTVNLSIGPQRPMKLFSLVTVGGAVA